MSGDKDKASQRGAMRVEASFPLAFREVAGSELDTLTQEILSHRTGDRLGLPQSGEGLPADLDNLKEFQNTSPAILKMWVSIDHKLDAIMKFLHSDVIKLENAQTAVVEDISATGIRVHSDVELKVGARLLMRITPPAYPSFTIDAIGEVLSVRKEGERFIYPMHFTAIHPDDREYIVTYVFKRQREILRGQRDTE